MLIPLTLTNVNFEEKTISGQHDQEKLKEIHLDGFWKLNRSSKRIHKQIHEREEKRKHGET